MTDQDEARERSPVVTAEAPAADRTADILYWEDLLADDSAALDQQAEWLRYNRELYASWVRRYLTPKGPAARVLKTDCFEETRGSEVVAALMQHYGHVVLMDLAHSALRRSAPRLRGLNSDRVQTAAQQLPFCPASFDAVISLSTLDHFASTREIAQSLQGLRELTKRGGELLLTLDNRANPIVWLRNALPFGMLRRLAISPYRYGATLGPSALRQALQAAGWNVRTMTTVVHAPRVISVAVSRWVSDRGPFTRALYSRCLGLFEIAGRWPTRALTGYFILAVCERKD